MKTFIVDLDDRISVQTAEDETEAIRLARLAHPDVSHVKHQTCREATEDDVLGPALLEAPVVAPEDGVVE